VKQKYKRFLLGWLISIAAYSCIAMEESVKFNDVPPDVLPKIFEYAVTPGLKEAKLLRLSTVCKTWESIVKSDRKTIFKKAIDEAIKEVFPGNEGNFRKFLNGRLIYKPNKDNDVGKIELRIGDLANPLEGTFNLSGCGEVGEHLSISTGYRKEKRTENAKKIEIWFTPRFLVEKEINGSVSHFKEIFPDQWPEIAPVGIFWTWGDWDNIDWYDYFTTQNINEIYNNDLYENYVVRMYSIHGKHENKSGGRVPETLRGGRRRYHFISCHGYFEHLYMHTFHIRFEL
jgi:hypothetical protein